MCCSGATWKREVVPEHKFDFVDTSDYRENSFWTSLRYIWLYIIVIKSFLVYVSDIFTAVTMLTTNNWTNIIYAKCAATDGATGNSTISAVESRCPIVVNYDIGKWVFVGCIIFGFLLLAYETRKTRKIIASRDISYAFTNVMANNYYSLRSYDHFCFFCEIANSTKKKDDFAFFIFFTFKDWKRLLLADGPRQAINAITLYSFASVNDFTPDLYKYYQGSILTAVLLITMLFTTLVFAGSLILLIVAGVCYVPLLCYIQGNLKEYCCHKIDKRITDLLKRRARQRVARQAALARKEAVGDFSHLRDKKAALPQPTLPNVNVDDEDDGGPYAAQVQRWSDYKVPSGPDYPPIPGVEYPPAMPGYDGYPPYNRPQQSYAQHHPYEHQQYQPYPTPSEESAYDVESEYGSTAHLTQAAAPVGYASAQVSQVSLPGAVQQAAQYPSRRMDYLDVERQAPSQGSGRMRPGSGLAYDDEPDYGAYYHGDQQGTQGHGRMRSGGSGGGGGAYAV